MSVQKTVADIKGIQILSVKAHVKLGLFILLVPSSAFCDRGSVTGGLVDEDWGKKNIEYPSLLHIPSNQVSDFLLVRSFIFSRFLFITTVPIEASLAALHVPDQIQFYQGFSFPKHLQGWRLHYVSGQLVSVCLVILTVTERKNLLPMSEWNSL